jgi:hypothetical protein
VLEINERPRRDLRLLIDAIGQRQVERALNVHRTTVRRWLSGQTAVPGAQHLAVRALLGDLPGTAGAWTGWRFHAGYLHSPANDTYEPGEILAVRLQQQRVAALDRENRELKARIRVLEKTIDLVSPAANQEQAHA